MKVAAIENLLFSVTTNPILKFLISRFDKECPNDGSLLLNSLRYFLGEPVALCPACQNITTKVAMPVYELGSASYK